MLADRYDHVLTASRLSFGRFEQGIPREEVTAGVMVRVAVESRLSDK